VAVVSFNVWQRGSENQDARAALDVAAEYYMNGGLVDDTARTRAWDAWRDRPGNATLTSARSYRCGDVAAIITTICTGGRTVATYVTLNATGGGQDNHSISVQRVVRVR